MIIDRPVAFAVTYVTGMAVTLIHPDTTYAMALVEGNLLAEREGLPGSGLSDLAHWRWRSAWQRVRALGPVFWLLAAGQMVLIILYLLSSRAAGHALDHDRCGLARRSPGSVLPLVVRWPPRTGAIPCAHDAVHLRARRRWLGDRLEASSRYEVVADHTITN